MKGRTTRWENVKGRAQYIHEKMDPGLFLERFGGPLPPGGECALALCEELDRMQEELTYVYNLVEHIREKLWKPVQPVEEEKQED